MKITYEYIDGSKRKPAMSVKLDALLWRIFIETYGNDAVVHIVHAGTVGDDRHRRDNPKSYHLHHPPDAIDIVKIFVKLTNPLWYTVSDWLTTGIIFKTNNPNWKMDRKDWASAFTKRGGRCYHASDKTKQHLHVEVKP